MRGCWLALLLVAGCFTFEPQDGAVQCGPDPSRPCPKGYQCAANRCWHAGTPGLPGAACTTESDCKTGFCVDGVCCESACDGVCETCNESGRAGTCAAAAAGTDPDQDCRGRQTVPDADGGIKTPPGGVFTNVAACAGKCDGNRACAAYPDATTSCGQSFCNDTEKLARYLCDGAGYCAPALQPCVAYSCSENACKTSCTVAADCLSTHYCDAQGTCAPKVVNGQTCAADGQCVSGNCVSNTAGTAKLCCNSACSPADNMQCDVSGMAGTCACGGLMSCTMGCALFYVDNDLDQHGDETGTLANGRAIAGCVGMAKITQLGKDYYPDDLSNKRRLDCDDADNRTFYGQTAFQDTPRPNPTALHPAYDFDCDTVETKDPSLLEYSHGCLACTYFAGVMCKDNNAMCSTDTNINPPGNPSGFDCGFVCPNGMGGYQCCGYNRSAFPGTVGCGVAGGTIGKPWTSCGTCAGGAPPQQTTDPSKKMACR